MKINYKRGIYLWGAYLNYHKGAIVHHIFFLVVFGIIIILYDVPLAAWGYAAILYGAVGLVLLVSSFYYFYKRYKELAHLQNTIGIAADKLPKPRNVVEELYEQLLRVLFEEKHDLSAKMQKQRQGTREYYTLWVHQIKTPIAAMRLLLQLKEDENSEEIRSELFKIEQYVDMVLSYLRMDSDSTDYLIDRYDLDEIVKIAIRKYAPLFIRKKIKLDFQPTQTTVLTDRKWLIFAVEQILSNSLKYTPAGTITIKMVENETTLMISDTGIGIAKEDLPRIFEDGFTGFNGRFAKGKSTGIGLYLCRRILRKLSHTIRVDSKVGVGTEVFIGLDHWQEDVQQSTL